MADASGAAAEGTESRSALNRGKDGGRSIDVIEDFNIQEIQEIDPILFYPYSFEF